jgi:hypothetical protein
MPFNVGAAYAADGGLLHGRYVMVFTVFGSELLGNKNSVYCRLALGDEVVDHGSYA